MKAIKIVGILLLVYVLIVTAFESLLGYFQPEAGGSTVVITTFDADGTSHDRVLSGLDSGGQFYVAVNHWPRAWYRRALANPAVRVTRGDQAQDYTAVPVMDDEHDRVQEDHPVPTTMRILMGFAPRYFLRLDPATG